MDGKPILPQQSYGTRDSSPGIDHVIDDADRPVAVETAFDQLPPANGLSSRPYQPDTSLLLDSQDGSQQKAGTESHPRELQHFRRPRQMNEFLRATLCLDPVCQTVPAIENPTVGAAAFGRETAREETLPGEFAKKCRAAGLRRHSQHLSRRGRQFD